MRICGIFALFLGHLGPAMPGNCWQESCLADDGGVGRVFGEQLLDGRAERYSPPPGPDFFGRPGNDFVGRTKAKNIESHLRFLTASTHMAGTGADFEQADHLRRLWIGQGFDRATLKSYDVLLSNPDSANPSRVQILGERGSVKFTSALYEDPVYPHTSYGEDVAPAFLAYSASGVVVSDQLVYANYGRYEDFVHLTNHLGISVKDKLVMIRYGKIFRGNKLKWAQMFGAKGAIVYSDPADYHPELGKEDPYPKSWWLPSSGIQRGTIEWVDGDQSTPMYPAIDGAYRVKTEDADLPRIICHPIGYNDAKKLLVLIGGAPAPTDWIGGLNVTYNIGPYLRNPGWKVKLEVHNKKEVKTVHNTIAFLYGKEEPDRYVLVGNHRDAWTYGSIDPSSGTAAMMEVVAALGSMARAGWRPRRTIVVGSWGGGEHGYLGSTEFMEEYHKVLGQRAVCHINVDLAVIGSFNLVASATPLMHNVLTSAAERVGPPEPGLGFASLREHWERRPRYTGDRLVDYGLASLSDHTPFYQRLGLPTAYFLFMPSPLFWTGADYPLYHSTYETFEAVKDHLDPDFGYHKAVADLWGLATIAVASHDLLPELMRAGQVGAALRQGHAELHRLHGPALEKFNVSTHHLVGHIRQYEAAAAEFERQAGLVDRSNALAVRRFNDRLLAVERAFVDEVGLPRRPWQKNVVFGTDVGNEYAGWIYPGVLEALFGFSGLGILEQERRIEEAKQQLAVVSAAVHSAALVLRDID